MIETFCLTCEQHSQILAIHTVMMCESLCYLVLNLLTVSFSLMQSLEEMVSEICKAPH
jgi:hypothetical protein